MSWKSLSRRSTQQVRISVLLHAIEILKNGITAVVDHFRDGAVPSVEAVSTVFQAYDDVGMRANVAFMFEDRRYRSLANFAKLVELFDHPSRTGPALGRGIPQTQASWPGCAGHGSRRQHHG